MLRRRAPRASLATVAVVVVVSLFVPGVPLSRVSGDESLPRFEKRQLTDRYFADGITAGDINRDGHLDIVSGPFWYEGPEFATAHAFYEPVPLPPEESPSNSMFSFVHDLDGDGWLDIIRLGRVHKHEARWFRNPQGLKGPWKSHFIFERVKGESPPFLDVDGDGRPEMVCHDGARWGLLDPDPDDPTKPWSFHPITPPGEYNQFYHGTGIGDVDGDGRLDLLLNDGWWEPPSAGARSGVWKEHRFRFGERGGAQMFAYDIDGDGDNDILTALDAHGWGLAWFEQLRDGDKISFRQHRFLGDRSEEAKFGAAFSQPHALAIADVDGDGLVDLITGKRRWAHGPEGDVEPNEAPVVYWFRLVREAVGVRFEPHLVDADSGVGVQIAALDVTGDGAVEILSASKLGAFLFVRRPAKPEDATQAREQ